MKFSLSWLKQHLETDADPATIADTLTAIGLEVEGVENPAEALAPFRVAKVLTAEKHPQADKLQVLTVDARSATATYTYNWEGSMDGRPFRIQGRGTRVLVVENGRLQIIHEHLSRYPKP